MHKFCRTHRTTYAQNHRVSAPRSRAGIYATEAGEGILKQTASGEQFGFIASVVERTRADGTPVYFVESDKFAGRFYFLYQKPDQTWVFSGESKLLQRYVAKVESFRAEQCEAVVA